ncbi:MAG TPA: terminase TerL endonuclease subunit, partial [Vicinamibacterales bacterium]|nr:terminase TerL endonuclease subunit [Vicinamibacterales bacterium]
MKQPPADPVTRYATDVVQGRIVAGRLVRLACQRHLTDLQQQRAKGLVWKPDEAQLAIDFFAQVLCLPEETAAEEIVDAVPVDGSPFVLQPFQQFLTGCLMGWYTTKGYRRFRDAYVETAKGSGKTPWGAGMMLYLLVADGERGAQCYFAAVTMAQAKEAGMTDAVKMVAASPYLRDLVDQKVNNLAVLETGSFLRAISSEKRGLDGKRVHGAFIDEEHEHGSPVVVSKVRRGTKGRRNALVIRATNSGFDRLSICWHDHEYSRKVLEGTIADESWFAYVCGLDPCAKHAEAGNQFPVNDCSTCDDWRVEGPHWLKANPNLGISLSWQYLRELVKQAKGRPDAVSDLLRFNFCIWTQAHIQAWAMGKWRECAALTWTDEDLVGAPCYGGLDLGQTDDFAAWARLWDLGSFCVAKLRFWLPRAALEKYPDRLYAEWERAGLLTVTDGDTTDVDLIEETILEDARTDGIVEIGYDKRFAHQLALHLQGAGVTMIDTPQGFGLNESIKSTAKLIADVTLAHGDNLILTWMMDNTVLRPGRNKQVRLDKDAAKEKIDGASAL